MFLKEEFLDDHDAKGTSSMTRPVTHTRGLNDEIESLSLKDNKSGIDRSETKDVADNVSKVGSAGIGNTQGTTGANSDIDDVIDITSTSEVLGNDVSATNRNKVLEQQREVLRRKEQERNMGFVRSGAPRNFSNSRLVDNPEDQMFRKNNSRNDDLPPSTSSYDRPGTVGNERGPPSRYGGERDRERELAPSKYRDDPDDRARRRPPPPRDGRDYPRDNERPPRDGPGRDNGPPRDTPLRDASSPKDYDRGDRERDRNRERDRERDRDRDRYGPVGPPRGGERERDDYDRDGYRPGSRGTGPLRGRGSNRYRDEEDYSRSGPGPLHRGGPPSSDYRRDDRGYSSSRNYPSTRNDEYDHEGRPIRRNVGNNDRVPSSGREEYHDEKLDYDSSSSRGGEYEEKGQYNSAPRRNDRDRDRDRDGRNEEKNNEDRGDSDVNAENDIYPVHKEQNSAVDIERTNSGNHLGHSPSSTSLENESNANANRNINRPKLDLTDMKTFVTKPLIKSYDILHCYIERNTNGANKLFPEYCLYMKDGDRFLLTSKKRSYNRTSNYLISLQRGDLSRSSSNFLGKLRSNFLGTEFTIYDNGINPKEFSDKTIDNSINQSKIRQELGIVLYASNVLGTRGPRKMKVCIPRVREDNSRVIWRPLNKEEEMLAKCKEEDHTNLTYLINKPPRWNENVCAYVLNFNGRVTMASVKNFQLVTPDDQETVVLQFGRVGKDLFTMDFRYPLSAFQAFAIALSSFDSKLACE